jgi:hypothetical protein
MTHAEQFAYMPYPQLDGEKETNESVYRGYPHPPPVAIEDLSSENKEILHSVSSHTGGRDVGGGAVSSTSSCTRLRESTFADLACACAPIHPSRSYKEVAPAFRNPVEGRAGTRLSLMKRGFRYHRPRVWSSAARVRVCSQTNQRRNRS